MEFNDRYGLRAVFSFEAAGSTLPSMKAIQTQVDSLKQSVERLEQTVNRTGVAQQFKSVATESKQSMRNVASSMDAVTRASQKQASQGVKPLREEFRALQAEQRLVKLSGKDLASPYQFNKAARETKKYTKALRDLETQVEGNTAAERTFIAQLRREQQLADTRIKLAKEQRDAAVASQKQGAFAAVGTIGGMVSQTVGKAGKDAFSILGSFEDSMSQLQAISGLEKGGSEINELRKIAKQLGGSTRYTATEVAGAEGFLAMAGYNSKEIKEAIAGTLSLAQASGMSIQAAADLASNVQGQFGLAKSEINNIGDTLAYVANVANTGVTEIGEAMKYSGKAASDFGADLKTTAALIGVMGDQGIQSSMAGTAMRSMFLRLAKPTGEAQARLDALAETLGRDSLTEENGKLRDIKDVLTDINVALEMRGAVKGTAARSAFLKSIFGAEAISGVGAALDGIEKVKRTVEVDVTGAGAKMAEVMEDNLPGALRSLSSAFEAIQLSFAETLQPILIVGVKALTMVLQVVEAIPGPVKFLIASFIGVVAVAGVLAAAVGAVTSALFGFQAAAATANAATLTLQRGLLPMTGFYETALQGFSGSLNLNDLTFARLTTQISELNPSFAKSIKLIKEFGIASRAFMLSPLGLAITAISLIVFALEAATPQVSLMGLAFSVVTGAVGGFLGIIKGFAKGFFKEVIIPFNDLAKVINLPFSLSSEAITESLKAFANWATQGEKLGEKIGKTIGDIIMAPIFFVDNVVRLLWGGLTKFIEDKLGGLLKFARFIGQLLVGALAENSPGPSYLVRKKWLHTIATIVESWKAAFFKLIKPVMPFVNLVKAGFDLLGKFISNRIAIIQQAFESHTAIYARYLVAVYLVKQAWQAVSDAITPVIEKIQLYGTAAAAVLGFIALNIGLVGAAITMLLLSPFLFAVKLMINGFKAVRAFAIQAFSDIRQSIYARYLVAVYLVKQAWEQVTTSMNSMLDRVRDSGSIFSELRTTVLQVFSDIREAIFLLPQGLSQVGSHIAGFGSKLRRMWGGGAALADTLSATQVTPVDFAIAGSSESQEEKPSLVLGSLQSAQDTATNLSRTVEHIQGVAHAAKDIINRISTDIWTALFGGNETDAERLSAAQDLVKIYETVSDKIQNFGRSIVEKMDFFGFASLGASSLPKTFLEGLIPGSILARAFSGLPAAIAFALPSVVAVLIDSGKMKEIEAFIDQAILATIPESFKAGYGRLKAAANDLIEFLRKLITPFFEDQILGIALGIALGIPRGLGGIISNTFTAITGSILAGNPLGAVLGKELLGDLRNVFGELSRSGTQVQGIIKSVGAALNFLMRIARLVYGVIAAIVSPFYLIGRSFLKPLLSRLKTASQPIAEAGKGIASTVKKSTVKTGQSIAQSVKKAIETQIAQYPRLQAVLTNLGAALTRVKNTVGGFVSSIRQVFERMWPYLRDVRNELALLPEQMRRIVPAQLMDDIAFLFVRTPARALKLFGGLVSAILNIKKVWGESQGFLAYGVKALTPIEYALQSISGTNKAIAGLKLAVAVKPWLATMTNASERSRAVATTSVMLLDKLRVVLPVQLQMLGALAIAAVGAYLALNTFSTEALESVPVIGLLLPPLRNFLNTIVHGTPAVINFALQVSKAIMSVVGVVYQLARAVHDLYTNFQYAAHVVTDGVDAANQMFKNDNIANWAKVLGHIFDRFVPFGNLIAGMVEQFATLVHWIGAIAGGLFLASVAFQVIKGKNPMQAILETLMSIPKVIFASISAMKELISLSVLATSAKGRKSEQFQIFADQQATRGQALANKVMPKFLAQQMGIDADQKELELQNKTLGRRRELLKLNKAIDAQASAYLKRQGAEMKGKAKGVFGEKAAYSEQQMAAARSQVMKDDKKLRRAAYASGVEQFRDLAGENRIDVLKALSSETGGAEYSRSGKLEGRTLEAYIENATIQIANADPVRINANQATVQTKSEKELERIKAQYDPKDDTSGASEKAQAFRILDEKLRDADDDQLRAYRNFLDKKASVGADMPTSSKDWDLIGQSLGFSQKEINRVKNSSLEEQSDFFDIATGRAEMLKVYLDQYVELRDKIRVELKGLMGISEEQEEEQVGFFQSITKLFKKQKAAIEEKFTAQVNQPPSLEVLARRREYLRQKGAGSFMSSRVQSNGRDYGNMARAFGFTANDTVNFEAVVKRAKELKESLEAVRNTVDSELHTIPKDELLKVAHLLGDLNANENSSIQELVTYIKQEKRLQDEMYTLLRAMSMSQEDALMQMLGIPSPAFQALKKPHTPENEYKAKKKLAQGNTEALVSADEIIRMARRLKVSPAELMNPENAVSNSVQRSRKVGNLREQYFDRRLKAKGSNWEDLASMAGINPKDKNAMKSFKRQMTQGQFYRFNLDDEKQKAQLLKMAEFLHSTGNAKGMDALLDLEKEASAQELIKDQFERDGNLIQKMLAKAGFGQFSGSGFKGNYGFDRKRTYSQLENDMKARNEAENDRYEKSKLVGEQRLRDRGISRETLRGMLGVQNDAELDQILDDVYRGLAEESSRIGAKKHAALLQAFDVDETGILNLDRLAPTKIQQMQQQIRSFFEQVREKAAPAAQPIEKWLEQFKQNVKQTLDTINATNETRSFFKALENPGQAFKKFRDSYNALIDQQQYNLKQLMANQEITFDQLVQRLKEQGATEDTILKVLKGPQAGSSLNQELANEELIKVAKALNVVDPYKKSPLDAEEQAELANFGRQFSTSEQAVPTITDYILQESVNLLGGIALDIGKTIGLGASKAWDKLRVFSLKKLGQATRLGYAMLGPSVSRFLLDTIERASFGLGNIGARIEGALGTNRFTEWINNRIEGIQTNLTKSLILPIRKQEKEALKLREKLAARPRELAEQLWTTTEVMFIILQDHLNRAKTIIESSGKRGLSMFQSLGSMMQNAWNAGLKTFKAVIKYGIRGALTRKQTYADIRQARASRDEARRSQQSYADMSRQLPAPKTSGKSLAETMKIMDKDTQERASLQNISDRRGQKADRYQAQAQTLKRMDEIMRGRRKPEVGADRPQSLTSMASEAVSRSIKDKAKAFFQSAATAVENQANKMRDKARVSRIQIYKPEKAIDFDPAEAQELYPGMENDRIRSRKSPYADYYKTYEWVENKLDRLQVKARETTLKVAEYFKESAVRTDTAWAESEQAVKGKWFRLVRKAIWTGANIILHMNHGCADVTAEAWERTEHKVDDNMHHMAQTATQTGDKIAHETTEAAVEAAIAVDRAEESIDESMHHIAKTATQTGEKIAHEMGEAADKSVAKMFGMRAAFKSIAGSGMKLGAALGAAGFAAQNIAFGLGDLGILDEETSQTVYKFMQLFTIISSIGALVAPVFGAIAAMMGTVVTLAGSIVTGVAGIGGAIGAFILSPLGLVVAGVIGVFLLVNWALKKYLGIDVLGAVVSTIRGGFGSAAEFIRAKFEYAIHLISGAWDWLMSRYGQQLQPMVDIATPILARIMNAFKFAAVWIANAWQQAVGWISKHLSWLIQPAMDIAERLISILNCCATVRIAMAWEGMAERIRGYLTGFRDFARSLATNLIASLGTLVTSTIGNTWQSLKDRVGTIFEWFRAKAEEIRNKMTGFFSPLTNLFPGANKDAQDGQKAQSTGPLQSFGQKVGAFFAPAVTASANAVDAVVPEVKNESKGFFGQPHEKGLIPSLLSKIADLFEKAVLIAVTIESFRVQAGKDTEKIVSAVTGIASKTGQAFSANQSAISGSVSNALMLASASKATQAAYGGFKAFSVMNSFKKLFSGMMTPFDRIANHLGDIADRIDPRIRPAVSEKVKGKFGSHFGRSSVDNKANLKSTLNTASKIGTKLRPISGYLPLLSLVNSELATIAAGFIGVSYATGEFSVAIAGVTAALPMVGAIAGGFLALLGILELVTEKTNVLGTVIGGFAFIYKFVTGFFGGFIKGISEAGNPFKQYFDDVKATIARMSNLGESFGEDMGYWLATKPAQYLQRKWEGFIKWMKNVNLFSDLKESAASMSRDLILFLTDNPIGHITQSWSNAIASIQGMLGSLLAPAANIAQGLINLLNHNPTVVIPESWRHAVEQISGWLGILPGVGEWVASKMISIFDPSNIFGGMTDWLGSFVDKLQDTPFAKMLGGSFSSLKDLWAGLRKEKPKPQDTSELFDLTEAFDISMDTLTHHLSKKNVKVIKKLQEARAEYFQGPTGKEIVSRNQFNALDTDVQTQLKSSIGVIQSRREAEVEASKTPVDHLVENVQAKAAIAEKVMGKAAHQISNDWEDRWNYLKRTGTADPGALFRPGMLEMQRNMNTLEGDTVDFAKRAGQALLHLDWEGLKTATLDYWENFKFAAGGIIHGFGSMKLSAIAFGLYTLASMSPILLILGGIALLTLAVATNFLGMRNIVFGLFKVLAGTAKFIWALFKMVARVTAGVIEIFKGLKAALHGDFTQIKKGATMIWSAIKVGAEEMWAAIKEIFTGFKQIALGVVQAVQQAFGFMWNSLVGTFQGLKNQLMFVVRAGDALGNLLYRIVFEPKAVWEDFVSLVKRLPQLIEQSWDKFTAWIGSAFDRFVVMLQESKERIKSVVASIMASMNPKNWFEKTKDGFVMQEAVIDNPVASTDQDWWADTTPVDTPTQLPDEKDDKKKDDTTSRMDRMRGAASKTSMAMNELGSTVGMFGGAAATPLFMVGGLLDSFTNLSELAPDVGKGLVKMMPGLKGVGANFKATAKSGGIFKALFATLQIVLIAGFKAIKGAAVSTWGFIIGLGWPVIAAIAGVTAAVLFLYFAIKKNWLGLGDTFNKVKNFAIELWQAVKDGAAQIFGSVRSAFLIMWRQIAPALSELWSALTGAWKLIAPLISKAFAPLLKIFGINGGGSKADILKQVLVKGILMPLKLVADAAIFVFKVLAVGITAIAKVATFFIKVTSAILHPWVKLTLFISQFTMPIFKVIGSALLRSVLLPFKLIWAVVKGIAKLWWSFAKISWKVSETFWNAVLTPFRTAWSVTQGIMGVLHSISNVIRAVGQAVWNFMMAPFRFIEQLIISLLEKVGQLKDKAVSFAQGIPGVGLVTKVASSTINMFGGSPDDKNKIGEQPALALARGGAVSGPGGPTDDRIPAMLSNQEFVVRSVAAQANLGLLSYLNSSGQNIMGVFSAMLEHTAQVAQMSAAAALMAGFMSFGAATPAISAPNSTIPSFGVAPRTTPSITYPEQPSAPASGPNLADAIASAQINMPINIEQVVLGSGSSVEHVEEFLEALEPSLKRRLREWLREMVEMSRTGG